jgi:hypothetical protein
MYLLHLQCAIKIAMLPAPDQDATRQWKRKERLVSEPRSNGVYAQWANKRKPHACGHVTNYVGEVELLDTFRREECRTLIGGLNRAPEMEQLLSLAVWDGR